MYNFEKSWHAQLQTPEDVRIVPEHVQCSGHFIKYIEFEVVFYMFLLNLLEPLENL